MPVSGAEDQTQNQDFVSEDDMQDCEDRNISGIEGDISDSTNSEFEAKPDFNEEEEDTVNPFADFTAELEKIRQQQTPCIKREPMPEPLGNMTGSSIRAEDGNHIDTEVYPDQEENFPAKMWASEMQLIKFRSSAKTIVDEYIKDQNIKLSHRSQRSSAPRDDASYTQGEKIATKLMCGVGD